MNIERVSGGPGPVTVGDILKIDGADSERNEWEVIAADRLNVELRNTRGVTAAAPTLRGQKPRKVSELTPGTVTATISRQQVDLSLFGRKPLRSKNEPKKREQLTLFEHGLKNESEVL